MIGNKLDLVSDLKSTRAVTYDEARNFAAKNSFLYFESSALIHKNVKEAFDTLVLRLVIRTAHKH